jgi:hypothetical protein
MKTCKSPAHKAYRDGKESVYLQAFIASRDLAKLIEKAHTDAGVAGASREAADHFQRDSLDDIVERIRFGQQEFANGERVVNAHFTRGCPLVPKEA